MRWTFEISEVRPGMGFFALKGEKLDGHALIPAALAAGAADIIDGQEELQRRARDYRRTLKATVIGVTGSSGKTTTKEFLKVFLAKAGKTHATDGNYNNIIGLPLTILECPPDADFLVLEMGTSSPGEIAALCDIAEPDVGVVTNVGTAHLEGLKTPEGIAEEKGTLLKRASLSFTATDNRFFPGVVDTHQDWMREALADILPGEHSVANACLAFAVAEHFGVSREQAAAALSDFSLPGSRWRKVERNGAVFIDDSYNANPDSMIAAIRALCATPCSGRRLAALGDMFELGPQAPDFHRKVFEFAMSAGLAQVFGVGEMSSTCPCDVALATVKDLGRRLREEVRPGDLVLLKASGAMNLASVLDGPELAADGASVDETPPSAQPDAADSGWAIFMKRMAEKATALGMTDSYFENASGLSLKSRISASDLLKLGEAAVANPTLARIWAATERTVEIGGPRARQETIKHVYAKLEGYEAFVKRYPFLGGKGGSICCDQLSVRAHLIVTEVAGERIVIALAGQEASDDPFALDLEICALAEAMLKGTEPPPTPGLAALEEKLGGYAFASLDGRLRCESRETHRLQVPSSATKVLTALCALDVVADVSRKLTLRSQDVRGGSGYTCYVGDEVSFEDALYSMMLPSSNTMAESVATAAGGLMLAENRRLGKAVAPGTVSRPPSVSVAFPQEGVQLPFLFRCYVLGAVDRGESEVVVSNLTTRSSCSARVSRTGAWAAVVDVAQGTNVIEVGGVRRTFSVKPNEPDGATCAYKKLDCAADVAKPHPTGKAPGEITVALDPGHGGHDAGTWSPHGFFEKDANLMLAKAVRDELVRRGYVVVMTREDDVAVELFDRPKVAHAAKADLFISIHHTAPGFETDPFTVRSQSVYAWNELGARLAKAINGRMAAADPTLKNNGVLFANFAVTRNPEIPSCLIEADFLAHPDGERAVWDASRRSRLAAAIADGVSDWVNG